MLSDVERGVETEIDFITGYVVQQAEKCCVPVPVNHMLLSTVRALYAAESGQTCIAGQTLVQPEIEEETENAHYKLQQITVVHEIDEVQRLRSNMQTKGNVMDNEGRSVSRLICVLRTTQHQV
jgi:hypothetical protein